jgi:hypothetical protein
MRPEQSKLFDSISTAFPPRSQQCAMTLRQGNEHDSYNIPTPDNPPGDWRDVSNEELEKHHWGLTHLDPQSWRFYLPAFLSYAVHHPSRGESLVIQACINNLRPPDREPSRFKTLSDAQRKAAVATLDFLAFDSESQFQDDACQALEEYWIERPLYPDV